jgi:hypothetical protein
MIKYNIEFNDRVRETVLTALRHSREHCAEILNAENYAAIQKYLLDIEWLEMLIKRKYRVCAEAHNAMLDLENGLEIEI